MPCCALLHLAVPCCALLWSLTRVVHRDAVHQQGLQALDERQGAVLLLQALRAAEGGTVGCHEAGARPGGRQRRLRGNGDQ